MTSASASTYQPRRKYQFVRSYLVCLALVATLLVFGPSPLANLLAPETAYANHLNPIAVVGHGIRQTSTINVGGLQKLLGTKMRFAIPTAKLKAGTIQVESRWDIEPGSNPGQSGDNYLRSYVHGWQARKEMEENHGSGSKDWATGRLFCWFSNRDNPSAKDGRILSDANVVFGSGRVNLTGGPPVLREFFTSFRRYGCANCEGYGNVPLVCTLRALRYVNKSGMDLAALTKVITVDDPLPAGSFGYPIVRELRGGIVSTDVDNLIHAQTSHAYTRNDGCDGLCGLAISFPWTIETKQETPAASTHVYPSTKYLFSSGWDACHGSVGGTPCSGELPPPLLCDDDTHDQVGWPDEQNGPWFCIRFMQTPVLMGEVLPQYQNLPTCNTVGTVNDSGPCGACGKLKWPNANGTVAGTPAPPIVPDFDLGTIVPLRAAIGVNVPPFNASCSPDHMVGIVLADGTVQDVAFADNSYHNGPVPWTIERYISTCTDAAGEQGGVATGQREYAWAKMRDESFIHDCPAP